MGNSKSGISTIFNLLERFNQREGGNILLDGKDIELYNIEWLCSNQLF